ncbi:hypothetical protein [Xanthomonas fragariae]|uniref:hypothetical protein n=1 Tax=Xanthomonas fragariae TaxID=48664 RepID=UPI0018D3223A|nr:hypothetical protein [Xanthomonas fragariae]
MSKKVSPVVQSAGTVAVRRCDMHDGIAADVSVCGSRREAAAGLLAMGHLENAAS